MDMQLSDWWVCYNAVALPEQFRGVRCLSRGYIGSARDMHWHVSSDQTISVLGRNRGPSESQPKSE